ncbi:MAG: OmpA family protein [Pseudomonadota bacterium]
MKKIIAALAAAILMTGCAIDPHTGERRFRMPDWEAVSAGSPFGAEAARDQKSASGATAAGTVIDDYMGRQEKKLRAQLQGSGVQIQREGPNLKLIMPGSVTFDTNSTEINPSFYPVLNSLGQILNEFSDTTLDVVGFTDATGGFQLNQRLSERRARSVAGYLIKQGISASRILTRGMGERYPIAPNDSETGRAQNRRVELNIRPRG